ncbi:hypothetical protein M885DRAFT_149261, partial [Pelagophyceae sp. CCMP2097]
MLEPFGVSLEPSRNRLGACRLVCGVDLVRVVIGVILCCVNRVDHVTLLFEVGFFDARHLCRALQIVVRGGDARAEKATRVARASARRLRLCDDLRKRARVLDARAFDHVPAARRERGRNAPQPGRGVDSLRGRHGLPAVAESHGEVRRRHGTGVACAARERPQGARAGRPGVARDELGLEQRLSDPVLLVHKHPADVGVLLRDDKRDELERHGPEHTATSAVSAAHAYTASSAPQGVHSEADEWRCLPQQGAICPHSASENHEAS